MSGLLGGVLPYVYSRGDALKRQIHGLLADPAASFEQTAGQLQDNHRRMQGLLDQAPTDPHARAQATDMAMAGLLGFAPVGMTKMAGSDDALRALRHKWTERGVKLDLYGKDRLSLSRIEVPQELREQGLGTEVMNDVVQFADANGKVVTLTPSSDFGGSVPRLREFYKRFGFVENKGRNKDYEYMDAMYRRPKD